MLHYYGDIVRRLFLGGAVTMLLTLPFVNDLLPVPVFASLLAITLLGFVAGLTNPLHRSVAILNMFIAGFAVVVFEYYAVDAYMRYPFPTVLLLINQALALNFLVALYFASKTFRGLTVRKNP